MNLTVLLDCCHSGTALDHTKQYQPLGQARTVEQRTLKLNECGEPDNLAISKMMAPPDHMAVPADVEIKPRVLKTRGLFERAPVHNYAGLLLSGCQSHQTSADAFLNGKYCGAATSAVLESMQKHNYNISHKVLIEEMNQFMVHHKFTQRPELDFGHAGLINNTVLRHPAKALNPTIEHEDAFDKYNIVIIGTIAVIAIIGMAIKIFI